MLRVESLRKAFAARVLFEGVRLEVRAGDRVGLVGRNGEGKTTLLRLLAGVEPVDDGRIVLERGARVGYLPQEVDPGQPVPVIEEVRTVFAPLAELEARVGRLEREMSAHGRDGAEVPAPLAERYDRARQRFEHAGGFDAEARLRSTLVGLGLGPERWDAPLDTLSGGWLMRVELAKLLLARPEVLLLDEPTNHLDLPSIRWFESVLSTYPGAVIVVSHDRAFLDRHTTRIAEIERGRFTVYRGNYAAYVEQKRQRRDEAAARRRNLEQRITELERFVERFGAKATKASQAQSRKKMLEKLYLERDALAAAPSARKLRFRFPQAPRSGDVVLRFEGLTRGFGEKRVWVDMDLELRRGQRIAVVGPNGTGKSTLLQLGAGSLPPESGTRELGHNVAPAFYAQHQVDALDVSKTVLEEIEREAPIETVPRLRNLLGLFLFSGEDVEKRVSVLSGGEKARLALAKLFLRGANFLLLDEPTNHLDIQARDVLTEALAGFRGTLLFTSHDRVFIDALATHVLEVRPGRRAAELEWYAGGFDAYARAVEEREQAGDDAPRVDERAQRRRRDATRRERERRTRKLRSRVQELEALIGAAEGEVRRIDEAFADSDLARDGDRMRALKEAHRALHQHLRSLYGEWEEAHEELETADGDETALD